MPIQPGTLTESCLAVHSGSAGTSFWKRNHSRPGVECRVQYSRWWSARIWTADRMMKVIRNRLRKCCQPTQAGMPSWSLGGGMVPGYRSTNACTEGSSRSALAAATPTTRKARPSGTSQSRLNHRDRPTRTMGAVPHWFGSEPDHVFGSTMFSAPVASLRRNSLRAPGVIPDGRGARGWCDAPLPGGGSRVTMAGR